jgi:hypothetical protein
MESQLLLRLGSPSRLRTAMYDRLYNTNSLLISFSSIFHFSNLTNSFTCFRESLTSGKDLSSLQASTS